jgi:predicted ArsR family transcriptional regulator
MKVQSPEIAEKRQAVLRTIEESPSGLTLTELSKILGYEISVNAMKAHCRSLLNAGKIWKRTETNFNRMKAPVSRNRYFAGEKQE